MSYIITVRVFQTNPEVWFETVERTVWHYANGGSWLYQNGEELLTMGGSGTCGCLRFTTGEETFVVALGVHNWERWCDIVPNLPSSASAEQIQAEYYDGKRDGERWKVRSECCVESDWGSRIEVCYTVSEGHNLEAKIIIRGKKL